MRKRKLVLGLAVAALLSLSIAGAAFAATGAPAQGQHRGNQSVPAVAGNGAAAGTTASPVGDRLRTQDRLQNGTCDQCVATGVQGPTPQTTTAAQPGAGNQYAAPSTAGSQTQTQTRLQNDSCGQCDGTCDGTGPDNGAGNRTQDRSQLCDGSCSR